MCFRPAAFFANFSANSSGFVRFRYRQRGDVVSCARPRDTCTLPACLIQPCGKCLVTKDTWRGVCGPNSTLNVFSNLSASSWKTILELHVQYPRTLSQEILNQMQKYLNKTCPWDQALRSSIACTLLAALNVCGL